MKPAAGRSYAVMRLSRPGKVMSAIDLDDEIAALTAAGQYKAIADLTGISHISSSLLGVLARFADECRQNHGELRLVVTETGVTNLLQVTTLDKVFEIYSSLEEAEEDF